MYGYTGIAIIVAAEVLLFAGNKLTGRWFTPIVWTGYILFVDSLVYRLRGSSLVATQRLELVIMAVISVAAWWLFELYNSPRFWQSGPEIWWHYHNLEADPFVRRVGYDWAFATIFPALFETAELFRLTLWKEQARGPQLKIGRAAVRMLICVGAIGAAIPLLVVSAWLVPVVWLAYIFFLDPLNYLRGCPSLTGDLSRGDYGRLASLLSSGLLCGVLWEFWNYWAISKWTYTVPYLGNVKLFEMPILGFLGFPPFAIECWAMYIFARSLLGPLKGVFDAAGEDSGLWPESQASARASNTASAERPASAALGECSPFKS